MQFKYFFVSRASIALVAAANTFMVPHVAHAAVPDVDKVLPSFHDLAKGCSEIARKWVRAAFHECGTYNGQKGGNTGSLQFELDRPGNEGLDSTVRFQLYMAKQLGISYADALTLGGKAGVEACGGPTIDIRLGRVDQGCADQAQLLPKPTATTAEMTMFFSNMNMSMLEGIALIGGGHTAGHLTSEGSPKARQFGPLDTSDTRFDSTFFKEITQANSPKGVVRLIFDSFITDCTESLTASHAGSNPERHYARLLRVQRRV